MISSIVWCAMMLQGVPVHAEGIILSKSPAFLTIRFNDGILAVQKTSCLMAKPDYGSFVPLLRRK